MEKGNKEVVIVHSDAVDGESAVVVVLHTAAVAHLAVVHSWKFVDFAGVTVLEHSLLSILRINCQVRHEVVLVDSCLQV